MASCCGHCFLCPLLQSLRSVLQGASGVIFAASGVGYWSAKGVDYQVDDTVHCTRCGSFYCHACSAGCCTGATAPAVLCSRQCHPTTHPPCLLQGVANVADVLKEQGGAQPVVLVSSCLVRCGTCGGLTDLGAAVALLRGLHQPSAAGTQRDRGSPAECQGLFDAVRRGRPPLCPAARTTAGTPSASC